MSRSVALAARLWHAAEVTPIPAFNDGTKRPGLSTWKDLYKTGRPTDGQIASWFPLDGQLPIFGLLTGNLSGGLEMFEFEGRAVAEGWMAEFVLLLSDNGAWPLWQRITQASDSYTEETPSGGIHVLYRVIDDQGLPSAESSVELASRPTYPSEREIHFVETGKPAAKQLVMIETRGEGGFTVTAPSRSIYKPKPNATWNLDIDGLGCWKIQYGQPGVVPVITPDERDQLYAIARMLDRMPVRPSRVHEIATRAPLPWEGVGTGTPLDDFEARTDWSEILEPHGWALVKTDSGGIRYWRRPGKDATGHGGSRDHAHSATTGKDPARDRLWVFSTSTELDAGVPMTKGYVYAALNHNGDLHSAAQDLKRMGFGRASQSTWADDLPIGMVADTKSFVSASVPDLAQLGGGTSATLTQAAIWGFTPTESINQSIDKTHVEGDRFPIASEISACYLPDEFWNSRPVLGILRQAAQSAMTSPEGVLAAALAYTIAHVMPNVVLPACIGEEASLNIMIVAVGGSASGKSTARKVAKGVLVFAGAEQIHVFSPSSGQGIALQYQHLERPKGEAPRLVSDRCAAMAIVDESDKIAALTSNAGNTLSSELRQASMGEIIGNSNVGDTKSHMDEGTYRFVLAMCMQPKQAAWLLEEKYGGLPQRFLFACVLAPVRSGVAHPGKWTVRLPLEATPDPMSGTPRSHTVMSITQTICEEIQSEHKARRNAELRGEEVDELQGHLTLLREKVAGALALLEGRLDINDEDWALSGMVSESSKAAIAWTKRVLSDVTSDKIEASRKIKVADAKAIKVAEVDTTEEKLTGDVARAIYEKIKRNTAEGVLKSEFTTMFGTVRRDYIGKALDKLIASNLVRFEKIEYRGREGSRWFLL